MRSKKFISVKSSVKSERQLYRQEKKVLILCRYFDSRDSLGRIQRKRRKRVAMN